MAEHRVVRKHSIDNGLLEGPRYDSELGLVFADAEHGGVLALDAHGLQRQLIPFRKGIGGLVLHADGGAVITGRNVAYKPFTSGDEPAPTTVLLDKDPAQNRVGFNDLTTDEQGRVYVGSLGFVAMHDALDGSAAGPPGTLWVIGLDGEVCSLADDIELSNGMAFDPSGTALYQADSGRRVIFRYELDLGPRLPTVKSRSVFAELPDGVPDGVAVDEAGTVWVALAHAGTIVGLGPDGAVIDTLQVPMPMVTSMCFGGPDLQTMYIVTGSHGADDGVGAGVFECRMDVPGLGAAQARTPTSTTTKP